MVWIAKRVASVLKRRRVFSVLAEPVLSFSCAAVACALGASEGSAAVDICNLMISTEMWYAPEENCSRPLHRGPTHGIRGQVRGRKENALCLSGEESGMWRDQPHRHLCKSNNILFGDLRWACWDSIVAWRNICYLFGSEFCAVSTLLLRDQCCLPEANALVKL